MSFFDGKICLLRGLICWVTLVFGGFGWFGGKQQQEFLLRCLGEMLHSGFVLVFYDRQFYENYGME